VRMDRRWRAELRRGRKEPERIGRKKAQESQRQTSSTGRLLRRAAARPRPICFLLAAVGRQHRQSSAASPTGEDRAKRLERSALNVGP